MSLSGSAGTTTWNTTPEYVSLSTACVSTTLGHCTTTPAAGRITDATFRFDTGGFNLNYGDYSVTLYKNNATTGLSCNIPWFSSSCTITSAGLTVNGTSDSIVLAVARTGHFTFSGTATTSATEDVTTTTEAGGGAGGSGGVAGSTGAAGQANPGGVSNFWPALTAGNGDAGVAGIGGGGGGGGYGTSGSAGARGAGGGGGGAAGAGGGGGASGGGSFAVYVYDTSAEISGSSMTVAGGGDGGNGGNAATAAVAARRYRPPEQRRWRRQRGRWRWRWRRGR